MPDEITKQKQLIARLEKQDVLFKLKKAAKTNAKLSILFVMI